MKRLAGTALGSLACVVWAGCGGEQPLSKAEYVKQADAVCAKSNKAIEEAGKRLGNGRPDEAAVEKFVKEDVIPMTEKRVADLRDLAVPEGDAEKLDKIYDSLDEALKKVEGDPIAIIKSGKDPFEDAGKQAADYGMKVCSSG